ncbi:hypothetical protein CKAN_01291300 [Cinnamomum micranthum f. kanehirae]|uniref:Uncharacterized protein n=1 Tax=Cinnamomum micranthum f. kanehirae TaxID=337451 RepID=A0A443P012_9MAGN|nr:hypothetical protein CKAN_01291300 [Cinnamomum micranthum f. kanehirae]
MADSKQGNTQTGGGGNNPQVQGNITSSGGNINLGLQADHGGNINTGNQGNIGNIKAGDIGNINTGKQGDVKGNQARGGDDNSGNTQTGGGGNNPQVQGNITSSGGNINLGLQADHGGNINTGNQGNIGNIKAGDIGNINTGKQGDVKGNQARGGDDNSIMEVISIREIKVTLVISKSVTLVTSIREIKVTLREIKLEVETTTQGMNPPPPVHGSFVQLIFPIAKNSLLIYKKISKRKSPSKRSGKTFEIGNLLGNLRCSSREDDLGIPTTNNFWRIYKFYSVGLLTKK